MNVHRFAVLTAASTLVLITAGGLVTSTGSGLAVPDWPLSYGTLFPPLVGGILYEHGHRMVATTVGFLTVVLAIWVGFRERRAWVRRLAVVAVAAVIVQGLLGGLTVLLLLPAAISVVHACLAQAFFSCVVTLAMVTSPRWVEAARSGHPGDAHWLRPHALAATLAIYLQLILGAVVRHTGSGLAIPDFPRAFGQWIPPLVSTQVAIHFAHRVGAVVVTVLLVSLVVRIRSDHRRCAGLRLPGLLLIPLLLLQITLGALTVWTRLAVVPATAHVAVGAMLLAMSLVVTLITFRGEATSLPVLAPNLVPRAVTP